MSTTVKQGHGVYRDMSATKVKQSFGRTLEQVLRGQRVRVTRHARVDERVVMIREADLEALERRATSPLEALRAEFDRMVEAMQSPATRKAAASVGTANTKALGKAALRARD